MAQGQGQYVEIAEEQEITRWQFRHPETGVVYASVFYLRVVPSDEQRRLRRKHTKFEFVRGVRQEVFDWAGFSDDAIDYAITNWDNVRLRGQDLPCARQHKLRLPELIKQEITRLCVGKELGQVGMEEAVADTVDQTEGEQSPRPMSETDPETPAIHSVPSDAGSNG